MTLSGGKLGDGDPGLNRVRYSRSSMKVGAGAADQDPGRRVVLEWIKQRVRRRTATLMGETLAHGHSNDRVRILIVMVVFATGFARLWVIEQRKRHKRKTLQQRKIER